MTHVSGAQAVVRALAAAALASTVTLACDSAEHAKQRLADTHLGEVTSMIAELRTRHLRGTTEAARRLAEKFALTPEKQPEGLRRSLRALRNPTGNPSRVVAELAASPLRFLVALDASGTVITRDVEDPANDGYRGENWKAKFEAVRAAFAGGTAIERVEDLSVSQDWSKPTWLFVAPVREGTTLRGAVVAGVPIENLAKLLTRQLQLDHAGARRPELWIYAVLGSQLIHRDTPRLVDELVPADGTRRRGFAAGPNGLLGEASQQGRPYAYLVVTAPPTMTRPAEPALGFVLLRSDAR